MNKFILRIAPFVSLITLWLWGGFIYYCIEILWRGYSHPSMFIVGGLCFLLLGGINNWIPWSMGIVWQAIIGAVTVIMVELISGLIINRALGLDVWDYSDMPFNLLGQICLPYFFAWLPISAVGIFLDDYLRWALAWGDKPHYTVF